MYLRHFMLERAGQRGHPDEAGEPGGGPVLEQGMAGFKLVPLDPALIQRVREMREQRG